MGLSEHQSIRLMAALARATGALEVAGIHYRCAATQSEARAAKASLDRTEQLLTTGCGDNLSLGVRVISPAPVPATEASEVPKQ